MSHPQLDELTRQLDAASARAQQIVAGATAQALATRPSPSGWSAAECLAHLTLTADAYLPLLDTALASAPSKAFSEEGRYRTGLIGGLLAWSLEPPYRMKTKTAPGFVPGPGHNPETVLADFLSRQAQLRQRLAACQGIDLNRVMVQSPFNARLRYNVYAAFTTLLAHERRHLWQAEQTLEKME